MKVIEDVLLKRTSVRRYEREKIEPEKLDLIYRAIASTPTSYNGQQYSVIAVEDFGYCGRRSGEKRTVI